MMTKPAGVFLQLIAGGFIAASLVAINSDLSSMWSWIGLGFGLLLLYAGGKPAMRK